MAIAEDDGWRVFSERLFDQNRFAIKLGLDNIRKALGLAGNPEKTSPAIVVGGTNGKGCTASMIASILQAHGLRVGLYTSPHLLEVRERFRIDGVPLPRDEVFEVGSWALERFGTQDSDPCLTFFEVTTFMAATLFEKHSVDVAIYEVGLGGRLDAVNAIEADLTVITTIGFDHQAYLGNTLAEITPEKAALLRSGTPAVIGPQEYEEAATVLKAVASEGHVMLNDSENSDYRERHRATAREAAQRFMGPRFESDRCDEGLQRWRWPGRLDRREFVRDHAVLRCIFDAAHNPDGIQALARHLADQPVFDAVVFASMEDKVSQELVNAVNDARFGPVWLVALETSRAASPSKLAEKISNVAGSGTTSDVVAALFGSASAEPKRVLVFGSVYLVGEVFAELGVDVNELVTCT